MRSLCLSAAFAVAGFIAFGSAAGIREKETGSSQAGQDIAQSTQQMVEPLNLTDQQKERLKLILQEQRKKREEILRDAARTRVQNQERRKALQEELQRLGQDGAEILDARDKIKTQQNELRDKLKAILTPQQREQWDRRAETGPAVITNSVGMKLVRIQPESFMMGMGKRPPGPPGHVFSRFEIMVHADESKHSQPVHKVTLTEPFYMGVYEVTQSEYRAIMGKNASGFKEGDNYPVENASWYAAQEFCVRLSIREGVQYRLPTEAEWEYACRAGTTTNFYWGDEYDPAYCWTHDKTGQKKGPTEVGQTKPNAWGLYDMLGNVQEWCEDTWVLGYPAGDRVDPVVVLTDRFGHRRGEPVLRGGMWWDGPIKCRSGKRACRPPESGFGFRVVRSAE